MGGHDGGAWVGLEVVQLGGEMVGLDRNWGQGFGFGKEVVQEVEGKGRWGGGVAPWMKMRSVFGTCMVSGIRRREKVRE